MCSREWCDSRRDAHFSSFVLFRTASWRTLGRIGGALIGAAVGAFAAKRLQETRAKAASIVLHNLLASKADPRSLTRQEVRARRACCSCPVDRVLCHQARTPTMFALVSSGRGDQCALWRGHCDLAAGRRGSHVRPVPGVVHPQGRCAAYRQRARRHPQVGMHVDSYRPSLPPLLPFASTADDLSGLTVPVTTLWALCAALRRPWGCRMRTPRQCTWTSAAALCGRPSSLARGKRLQWRRR